MSTVRFMLLGIAITGMVACSKPAAKKSVDNDNSIFLNYENELFSVKVPKGWVCDSSEWKGLDSLKNVVDIYDPNSSLVWFHFVKTFMPFKWENIDEAKQMAIAARALSGDNVELLHETDSIEISGYPTCILYFANYVDNDTIIQKQYVTYLNDSHIVVYFNENFHVQNWNEAQSLGDVIIENIKLKKIKNPLDNDSIFKKSMEAGFKNHQYE